MGFSSVELFAGAGGLALGGALCGLEHQAMVEINPVAGSTLRHNAQQLFHAASPVILTQDVRNVSFEHLGHIDIVTGGPPCQPFSLGGKGLAHNDERDMFPAAVSVIRQTQPSCFVLENVKGLLRESFASYFSYIILRLTYPEVTLKEDESWQEHLGRLEQLKTSGYQSGLTYHVVWRLVNAADYGVPQRRERVFIVGFRSDLDVSFSFPEPTHCKEALLCEQENGGSYWERYNLTPPQDWTKSKISAAARERVRAKGLRPWRTVRDVLSDLPEPNASACLLFSGHIYQPGARSYPGHTGSVLDLPAKTIKAGAHGVPGGENMLDLGGGKYRYLTVREAARLQTFPDSYSFAGTWSDCMKQIGNAVPVRLAQIILTAVSRTLAQVEGRKRG